MMTALSEVAGHTLWPAYAQVRSATTLPRSVNELDRALPYLLDTDLREAALKVVGHMTADTDGPGIAFARALLRPSDPNHSTMYLLRARAIADPSDGPLQARIARDLGARYLASGQPAAADAILRSTRAGLAGCSSQMADLVELEALIADYRGEWALATRLHERTLDSIQNALTPMTHALSLVNLAAARESSDPRSSASLARLALQVIEAHRLHQRAEAAARNVLGFVLIVLGDLGAARTELTLSASIAHRTHYAHLEAFARFNLAIHAELTAGPASARRHLVALRPLAIANQLYDLREWIDVRLCWLDPVGVPTELEGHLLDLESQLVGEPQRAALRIAGYLKGWDHACTAPHAPIAAALERQNMVDAFALELQLAAREHVAGRSRSARKLVSAASALARERGIRAAPNWWSDAAVRVASNYDRSLGEHLIPTAHKSPAPVIGNTMEDLPAEIWQEGRTGARVLRRLFTLLREAYPLGVDRDELCDSLWPDTDGDKAVRNLYSAVDDLRRALRHRGGLAVVNEDQKYRLSSASL